MDIAKQIIDLKKEKNATILVHNYQTPDIYEIGDFIGDSLELARKAQETDSDIIVFCGVDFMAESAKVLNPKKKVLLPSKLSKCPMAAMADPEKIRELKSRYEDAAVVSYINTTAETKAVSDICCTSANSVKIINSLKQKNIIFVPDRNLASYTQRHTDKNIIPWEGHCYVHSKISKETVIESKKKHPHAVLISHPECNPEIIDISDHVESTSGMARVAKESDAKEFIIATECGMIEKLKLDCPGKVFYAVGGICVQMKKITLQKVFECLRDESGEVIVEKEVAKGANVALNRMLQVK